MGNRLADTETLAKGKSSVAGNPLHQLFPELFQVLFLLHPVFDVLSWRKATTHLPERR